MSEEDDWVKSAEADDSIVAELLMRLPQSETPLRKPCLLEWGVRQPRSRQIVAQGKKIGELTRASPTTPLSWSAGTSISGGGAGDGYEESSVRLSNARSKVNFSSDINGKRSRKKKTFAELKDQENFLMKEATLLKRALASERMLYEKEKARNGSLKRLKVDLQTQSPYKPATSTETLKKPTLIQSYQPEAVPSSQTQTILPANRRRTELVLALRQTIPVSKPSEPPKPQKSEIVEQQRLPVLPDLNMLPDLNLPIEEDLL